MEVMLELDNSIFRGEVRIKGLECLEEKIGREALETVNI